MLGCLEVVEYSLKERVNMKHLHQVSCLRLQDVMGVCLSYCCLSGAYHTIGLSGATCVLVVVQYTADYPVQRIYLGGEEMTPVTTACPKCHRG